MNDPALVAAMVSGDPEGLAGAYRAYADRLYTYCHDLLADREAAGQAVHDTFVLASQCADQLQDPERLRYWLYAIARNECLRQVRHRPRGHNRESSTSDDEAMAPGSAPELAAEPAPEPAELEPDPEAQSYQEPGTDPYPEPELDPYLDVYPDQDPYQEPYLEPEHEPEPDAYLEPQQEQEQRTQPDPGLIRAATRALTDPEREALELATRHGFPAQEIGALLGCSTTQARDRVAKARAELERALTALWAARSAPNPCPGLIQLLGGASGVVTPRSRKQVARHLRTCPSCTEDTQRESHPTALIPPHAEVPFEAAPPLLWPRIELHAFDPGLAPERDAVRRRAGRFASRTGFPRQPDDRRRRRQLVLASTVTVVGLALLAAGFIATLPAEPAGGPQAAQSPSAAASEPSDPDASAPNGQPPLAAQAAPPEPTGSPEPTPTQPPPPPPEPAAPPPLTVDAGAELECVAGGLLGFRLEVSADASQQLDSAELLVTADSGSESFPLAVDGSAASGESDVLFGDEVEWQVEVTGAGGESTATVPAQIPDPCS